MVNVAILGFGVVGSGVAEVLDTNGRHIEGKVDDLIRLKYILDVRDFPDSPFAGKVVHDFSVIEQDPEVSIVVETIGGAKVCLLYTSGFGDPCWDQKRRRWCCMPDSYNR